MSFETLLKTLLPPGAYVVDAPNIGAELKVMGNALENLQAESADLLANSFPNSCVELLPAWERNYGIKTDPMSNTAARLNTLLSRALARGGLSPQYFIALAAAVGYTATIREFLPCMAGWGRCGDVVHSPDVLNIWQVVVQISAAWIVPQAGLARCGDPFGTYPGAAYATLFTQRATAGVARCGNSIANHSTSQLETFFNALKPAHTYVFFTYA
ncbi:MAG: DUF2313 domain-containing protein [Proteobacteria bacterium]|nr:DUF2313 domain-containing protein [Pseudomonadota bacterium]